MFAQCFPVFLCCRLQFSVNILTEEMQKVDVNIATSLLGKIRIHKNNIHFNVKVKIRASRQNIVLFIMKMSLYEAACTLMALPEDAFGYTQQSNQHPWKMETFFYYLEY